MTPFICDFGKRGKFKFNSASINFIWNTLMNQWNPINKWEWTQQNTVRCDQMYKWTLIFDHSCKYQKTTHNVWCRIVYEMNNCFLSLFQFLSPTKLLLYFNKYIYMILLDMKTSNLLKRAHNERVRLCLNW